MTQQFPLIPFLTSWEDITFLFFVFARVSGLFILAPIFGSQTFPKRIRIGLTVFVTVLITMVIYPNYRGDSAIFILPELQEGENTGLISLALLSAKELTVGYLIGFSFSLIFESVMIAGQSISAMVGLSAAEMFDPLTNTSQSILGQLFVVLSSLLFFIFDMHHTLFILLSDSFNAIPIGTYHMPHEMQNEVIKAGTRMFSYGMKFAAIPYVTLMLVTVALGLTAKVMPEMNIFIVGMPLKILLGFYTLTIMTHYFPTTFKQTYFEFSHLTTSFFQFIGNIPVP